MFNYSFDSFADAKFVEELYFPYYLQLLAIACTYHLREELDELLVASRFFKKSVHADIDTREVDQPFVRRPLIDQPLSVSRGSGSLDTLLGIASFHGHLDLVVYLVAEKKADVNAVSADGNTPLHNVVRGDSYPVHHHSYGTQHAEVAKYLILHKADLTIKNRHGRTPLEEARRASAPKISFLFSNAVRNEYCADKVRPVLGKAREILLAAAEEKAEKDLACRMIRA